MARRVIHLFTGEFLSGHGQKTLCNREMTHRYQYTDDIQSVTCPRCLNKLNRLGVIVGVITDKVIVNHPSDVDCGDEHIESWLYRLGVG